MDEDPKEAEESSNEGWPHPAFVDKAPSVAKPNRPTPRGKTKKEKLPRRISSVVAKQANKSDLPSKVDVIYRVRRPSFIMLAAALCCWLISLAVINVNDLSHVGFVGALPIVYFLGLGLVAVSFVVELLSERPFKWLLISNLVLLIFMVHGTIPLVFPEPHYPWTYKHFGVTNQIIQTGELQPKVDIYQNWPGFFAISAWFSSISGLGDPIHYGAWWQVFTNLCAILLLAFIYRSLTNNVRVIWLGMFLFVCASWVGQDYYSPQAFVFVLSLGVMGIVVRWILSPTPRGFLFWFTQKIVPVSKKVVAERFPDGRVWRTPESAATWSIAGAAFIFFVITSSHQLTPFLMLAGLAALMLFGVLKEKSLFFLLLAICIVYLLPHLPFVQERYGVFSDLNPLSNAKNSNVKQTNTGGTVALVAEFARGLSIFVWILGVCGFVRRLRQGHREIVAGLLMLAPFIVIGGQSYGGEAIYRVYLFSLPWAAFLAAHFLLPLTNRRIAVRSLRPLVPIGVCLALLMPAYFGLESTNEVRRGEVAASYYFYKYAPKGSLLVTIAPSFPLRAAGTYGRYQQASGDGATAISTYPDFKGKSITTPELERYVDGALQAFGGTGQFLVLSKGQQTAGDLAGILRPTTIVDLDNFLRTNPNWRQFYRNDDAVLWQYAPPGP